MAVVILTEGGATPPNRPGPVMVSASGASGVRLELQNAAGQTVPPSQRMGDDTFIIQPSLVGPGNDLVVVAVASVGGPFRPGTTIGLTLTHPSRPVDDMVVMNPVDASGRSGARLVRFSSQTGTLLLHDAFNAVVEGGARPLTQRGWHERGRYAFHASHAGAAARGRRWAMVIDGSATLLAPERRASVGQLVETVFGLMLAECDGGPHSVRVTKLGRSEDIASYLDREHLDWAEILGERPSPWSAVLPALKESAKDIGESGVVVAIVDGPPADAAAVVNWALTTSESLSLRVVGIGRSHHEALSDDKPAQWWDEEFAVLEPLALTDRHAVVTISDEAKADSAAVGLAGGLSAGVR